MRRTEMQSVTETGREDGRRGSRALEGWGGGLFSDLERMVEDSFGRSFLRYGLSPMGELIRNTGTHLPPMDLFEEEGTLVVRAELPGLTREEVTVNITGNVLVVSGEKRTGGESREKGYLRRETSHGRFSRSIMLPEGIDGEHVTAKFRDGVLEIRIPRVETGSRKISIQ